MAISETTLRDVMLMLIEQQNAAGGLLGRNWCPSSSTAPRTGRPSPNARELLTVKRST
jgi:urea transport system substrate-binding protein